MANKAQTDPAQMFINNLLDPNYYGNNVLQPQDIIEYFLHSSNIHFINSVYSKLKNMFSGAYTLSLSKLLIIHFFKYTQNAQRMIEINSDYADHFVSFTPMKRWQTALEFRAISSLIPSICAVSDIINPKIRSDTLFLMRMINGLESSDPEVFESAKDTLQELGRKISPLQSIYIQCIKMPFLLIFLPDMISDSNLVHKAISVYNSLFQVFIQKKLKSENNQQSSLVPIDGKNRFNLLFENESPCEFLHDVLSSVVRFIRNLKVFPRNLFSSFIELFHSLIPDPSTVTVSDDDDHSIYHEACCMIFDTFSSIPEYLRPYQIHVIADISINFILSLPIQNDTTFSSNLNDNSNPIQKVGKKILKSPLRMLSHFRVTDEKLTAIQPLDSESASLLVSVFPRPSDENGTNDSAYADQVVKIFRPFQNDSFTLQSCRLFLSHLIDFIPHLSEEAHSIIIEVLLPNLMKQSFDHQDLIARFLSSISFATNADLLSLYLIFANSFPDGCQLTPKLKAVCLSLFYLARDQPNEQFTKFSVSEIFDCAKELFLIGEYNQPSRMWGLFTSESSAQGTIEQSAAEAFKILSSAESLSALNDHSGAAHDFIRAADAFDVTSFQHDFHLYYVKARHFFESVCFQVELMSRMRSPASSSSCEPLSASICDIDALLSNLKDIEESSLLLHPKFDEVSLSYVRNFVRIANEMIASIDRSYEEFIKVVAESKILPPPAILSTEQPINIEDVRIINPDIEIKSTLFSRQFYIELRGKVVYNAKFFNDEDDDEACCTKEEERGLFDEEREKLIMKEIFEFESKRDIVVKEPEFFFLGKKSDTDDQNHLNSNECIFSIHSDANSRGVEWAKESGMKIICHVYIPINGTPKIVHTQEVPCVGEFSVDFPIVAEYKEMCPAGSQSDFGHNMRVTIFFTAVFDGPTSSSHYRIGREERYIYIHES